MKKKFIYTGALILLILLCFFISCSNDTTTPTPVSNNNDSCGDQQQPEVYYSPPFTTYGFPSTYTLGSERYYNFYAEIDSICTDNHISASFYATTNNIPTINFRSAIEWQIFWEKVDTGTVSVNGNDRKWESHIENLGLRIPFNDNAATVIANIYVHFPTQGSQSLDSAYLIQNLRNARMVVTYKYHKPTILSSDKNTPVYNDKTELPLSREVIIDKNTVFNSKKKE